MKRLLTILFLLTSISVFGQMGIINYDTIQAKAIQVDSAFWIDFIEHMDTDSILVRSGGKVGYVLKSDIKDSVFVTITSDTLFVGNDTIISDLLTDYDTTGFKLTIPQTVDLTDTLTEHRTDINQNVTNIGELRDISDYATSPMIISGGSVTEGTNAGTFKVAALTALLRKTDSETGELTYVTLAEQDNQTITSADVTYFVSLNYNSGSPTISLSLSNPYAADKRNIPIGKVMKDGSDNVHYISGGYRFQDGVKKLHTRARTLRILELASGNTIAYSGTNNFTMTAGKVYAGINEIDCPAYDSETTSFTAVYRDGSGGWTETDLNAIDYAHYDDGDGTLGTVKNNKYGCFWVYRHADDYHVYVVYGRDSYSLAEAVVTKEPTRPTHLVEFGCLIGRIITPATGGSFTSVDMVTDRFFVGTAVGSHNALDDLQGGEVDNYYHLTNDELLKLQDSTLTSTDLASYISNADEADPLFRDWDKMTGINIYEKQVIDLQDYLLDSDLSGIRDTMGIHEDSIANYDLRLIEVEGLDTTGIYHSNRAILDAIDDTWNDFTEWDKDYQDLTNKPNFQDSILAYQTDDQQLSIDSTDRTFTISLEDGGSVKFKDTNTQIDTTNLRNDIDQNATDISNVRDSIPDYEEDLIYANDSANIVWFKDLTDSLNVIRDTTDALRTDINQNTSDISTLNALDVVEFSDTTSLIASKYDIDTLSINIYAEVSSKQDELTTGNLTENVTGLEFDNTRQVIGGVAQLSLSSGYAIPATTNIDSWNNAVDSIPVHRTELNEHNDSIISFDNRLTAIENTSYENYTHVIETFYEDDSTPTEHSLSNTGVEVVNVALNGSILRENDYTFTSSTITLDCDVYKYDEVTIIYLK